MYVGKSYVRLSSPESYISKIWKLIYLVDGSSVTQITKKGIVFGLIWVLIRKLSFMIMAVTLGWPSPLWPGVKVVVTTSSSMRQIHVIVTMAWVHVGNSDRGTYHNLFSGVDCIVKIAGDHFTRYIYIDMAHALACGHTLMYKPIKWVKKNFKVPQFPNP